MGCVKDVNACPRVPICASRDVWVVLGGKIAETLNSFTLEQLLAIDREKAEKALMHDI